MKLPSVNVPPHSWRPMWLSVSSALPSWLISHGKKWLNASTWISGVAPGSDEIRGSGNISAPASDDVDGAPADSSANVIAPYCAARSGESPC